MQPSAGGGPIPWAGYLLAAAGATLFSTKGVLIKLAYAEGVSVETLLALRMGLSLPVYLVIGLIAVLDRRRTGRALPTLRVVGRAAAVGVLGYWFASYVDFLGLQFISAQFERLILFTSPAFVVILGALFFGQRIKPRTLFGIAMSYAGLLLMFATNLTLTGSHIAIGTLLVLAAAVAFALYQLLAKDVIALVGPRLFTCIAMSAASAAAILQFAVAEPLASLAISPRLWAIAICLAIGATVLPSFLLNAALHKISAQANATIGTLSPVATIVLAVAILGEAFTWTDAAGTALVIGGVAWFTLADRRR